MNKSSSKVWKKLFSPPCPKCSSIKTKEELREIPMILTGKEFVKMLKQRTKKEPSKPIRAWKCLDCGTRFDEKGRYIAFF